jgi:glycosyltransferase involved in cell wall biosynthesis
MNYFQLARNCSLIASTAARHFADDPVRLLVLASQKLPGRITSKLGALSRMLPQRTYISSVLSLVGGDQTFLQTQLRAAQQAPGTRLRVALADVAIAGSYPDLASELLRGTATTERGAAPTIARLRWHNGDMSGAVDALAGVPGRRARHMRIRLESERDVFHGWRPTLDRVESYDPAAKTVLHILTNSLPHTGSGYAQRTHSILKAQRQLGWDVHAVTRPGYPVQLGKLAARNSDRLDDVVYHRILPARLPEGMTARLQLQAKETLRLALRLRPAMLHTTTHFVNALVTAAVAEALGIPWVYEVRGQLADTWASARGPEAADSERYRTFVAREAEASQRADGCATLGTTMRDAIAAQGPTQSEVVLLPNAVGEAFLKEPLSSQEARQQLGLPAEGTFVGTVSSLVGYEGLDDLIAAFVSLAKNDSELRCLIVGAGAAENSLRQQARESGFSHRIVFTGRVDRGLAHLYHQALDIFVLPRKDNVVTRSVTPLKPVEALASARPVVFSDLPALQETIQEGAEGVSFDAGNRGELARAIASLAASPEMRHQMGQMGRDRILAERTWSVTAARIIEMYERLKVSQ